METNNEEMETMDNSNFEISKQVQIKDNFEGFFIDVHLTFIKYSEEYEDGVEVGETIVRIYDDSWADFLYASDVDGNHIHIFSSAVKQTNPTDYGFENLFSKSDNQKDLMVNVSGRVAVMDMDSNVFLLEKEYWHEEIAKTLFQQVEAYLKKILKVDFIVLDLNHSSLESALESPGLLLLANAKNLANYKTDMELDDHLEKVQECLTDFEYEDTGYMAKEIYMVKELG